MYTRTHTNTCTHTRAHTHTHTHTRTHTQVYKASIDREIYALKEFSVTSDMDLQSLMREAAVLRRMRHPTIVEIISVFESPVSTGEKIMYLQMPFFEHGSLDKWITTEAPEWRSVRVVLLDVAMALEWLHDSSIVHCDVKPANILVASQCRGRLADFDISLDSATRTASTLRTNIRVGYTQGFDAPELAR